MSKVTANARLQAFQTNFELACIFSILVILADMTWLGHDILVNGFSIVYGFIGLLMIVGFVGTIVVVVRHNHTITKKLTSKPALHKRYVKKMTQLRAKHEALGIDHNPRAKGRVKK